MNWLVFVVSNISVKFHEILSRSRGFSGGRCLVHIRVCNEMAVHVSINLVALTDLLMLDSTPQLV